MTDSVDVILEFLRRNRFTRAEAALLGELSNRPELSAAAAQKLGSSEKIESCSDLEGVKDERVVGRQQGGSASSGSGEVSKELIVKEIECGSRNGSDGKWRVNSVGERSKGSDEKRISFGQELEDNSSDLYSWKSHPSNGPVDLPRKDSGAIASSFSELQLSGQSKNRPEVGALHPRVVGEEKILWPGSTSRGNVDLKAEPSQKRTSECGKYEEEFKPTSANSKDISSSNLWPKNNDSAESSLDWRECSVKTVLPFSMGDDSMNFGNVTGSGDYRKEGKKKVESNDIRAVTKEQVDEIGRSLFFGKPQGVSDQGNIGLLDLPLASENHREELPRLPPVKLKSEDKPPNIHWDEKIDRHAPGTKLTSSDNAFLLGSFLDVPIGQEISTSGGKRTAGSSWLSVSQGIAEDTSDLVSGFATIGDGISELIGYTNDYWDSDEYDDDEDVGYMRQPIEDETWFLAHEIDYPSDNEKGTGRGSVPDQQERGPGKDEEDDQSFAEEDSYFSGEQYFQGKNIEQVAVPDAPLGHSVTEIYERNGEDDMIAHYDGQLMDEEELSLMRAEPVWQGFVTQSNDLLMLGNGRVLNECDRPRPDDLCIDDDQHGSVRSIGVGISSDAADIGSEVRESLVGGSSEGDLEYFHDHDVGISGAGRSPHDTEKRYLDRSNKDKVRTARQDSDKYITEHGKALGSLDVSYAEGGFSFPPPLRPGDPLQASSDKSLWSKKRNDVTEDENNDHGNGTIGTGDTLATWRRKDSDSSLAKSSRDENNANATRSSNSTTSTNSNYGFNEREHANEEEDDKVSDVREEDPGSILEDEEAAAVQEQVRQIKAQEEEFETFNLKIVHRKNRHALFTPSLFFSCPIAYPTGFEEDKNFHVVLNSVIAGRYHVTEYLGSAAFSKAIQAHDLHTGMDVCVKIIKNNKDFFDQSLDEIKLLKFVNKNDPADKYHILRLYDYFYYREHLLIVCELLKANLYEFHKFNRESGGEVYFTMPRLQSITIQCLEALQFLHGLGLIHCDLKPENILVKSYSRCEVKVIDLGSSCFQTDHLCSYVQSRSYRAPEVILGLPYDKKIDIWSLGCILAELCTGNVLFQNDSPATLLARVIGIIGPIEQGMLAKGRDTYKYFTKNHMLYERNQWRKGEMTVTPFMNIPTSTSIPFAFLLTPSTPSARSLPFDSRSIESNRLEYLIPKKTSLRHRLPMGDQGFVDFVAHLLEVNPKKRPTASEALKHPWLSYPYEPISS
ncbi:hypothetical protein Sjap_014807 [Stephania japonica]|uniref:Protein kinase domain-containing protein n=1 Tax=Stephania japonica TaxID=461633 RepID=A0AAP0IIS0_9MAGN